MSTTRYPRLTPPRVSRCDFDFVLPGHGNVCVSFTRTTRGSWENEGADADGRRGRLVFTIEDDDPSDITVEVDGGPARPPNELEASAISDAIANYCRMYPVEDDEAEPDPDERYDEDRYDDGD